MHSTHLSTEGMNQLYKNQFNWPNISKDVDVLYKNCKQSLQCHTSLQQLAQGEGVSIDFMPHNSQDVLIIKDKMSGYVANMLCKKQTSKVDYVALPPLIYSYRIPYKDL